jgi:hypothetical protein
MATFCLALLPPDKGSPYQQGRLLPLSHTLNYESLQKTSIKPFSSWSRSWSRCGLGVQCRIHTLKLVWEFLTSYRNLWHVESKRTLLTSTLFFTDQISPKENFWNFNWIFFKGFDDQKWERNKSRQITIFGFLYVAKTMEGWVNIHFSYLGYNQIWLNLPRDDDHWWPLWLH